MRAIINWFKQPCDWYQIVLSFLITIALSAFMEYHGSYRLFNFVVTTMHLSIAVGMVATRKRWLLIEYGCLLISGSFFVWMSVWLYFHFYG